MGFCRAMQIHLTNKKQLFCTPFCTYLQARRRGGTTGSNEPPLQVNINDGGLKTQAANFQLLANSGGLENKL